MSTISMYQLYLVAEMVAKRVQSVGAKTDAVTMVGDYVVIHLAYVYDGGAWDSSENREAMVAAFLEHYPDSELSREPKTYGDRKPHMKVSGTSRTGVHWEVDFGDGVCELVQVGTKQVEVADPEVLATVPRVTVDEPVFEYRCPDPIVKAGLL